MLIWLILTIFFYVMVKLKSGLQKFLSEVWIQTIEMAVVTQS